MQQIFKTSGIAIDDVKVTITKHPDGSMLFTDRFIPGIKLKDIISNGGVVIDPSVLVQIEIIDWLFDPVTALYGVDVPHQFGLVGSEKAQILVLTSNLDYETILMNSIQVKENSVFITSTSNIDMYVTMKRI